MFVPAPRVQVPATAGKGQVFSVKALISHPMETGLRYDGEGKVILRKIINKFTCRYGEVVVFSVDLHESVAADLFIEFYLTGDRQRFARIRRAGRRRRFRLEQQIEIS